jgi:hypothetical protein
MEEDIKIAWSEYNIALVRLNKMPVGSQAFGAEAKYAQSYQRLVQLGVCPQLKLKYRG